MITACCCMALIRLQVINLHSNRNVVATQAVEFTACERLWQCQLQLPRSLNSSNCINTAPVNSYCTLALTATCVTRSMHRVMLVEG
jgi:hypothetical protein